MPDTNRKTKSNTRYFPATTLGWLGFAAVLSGIMFFVGVLVGRGSAPFHFNFNALQSELSEMKRSFVAKKEAALDEETADMKNKTDLNFYENLKTPLKKPPREAAGSAEVQNPTPATAAQTSTAPDLSSATLPDDENRLPDTSKPYYTVQVAATKDETGAKAMADALKKAGQAAYVETSRRDDGVVWYRVRVGRFAQKDKARQQEAALKEKYKSTLIIKVTPPEAEKDTGG